MTSIPTKIHSVFFPKTDAALDFPSAVNAIETQRIARITKIALYTLAAIAIIAALVLTEAAVIAWPIALPIIAVALVAGIAFYRLNNLDEKYLAKLDDPTRMALAKKELETLFNSPAGSKTAKEIEQTLCETNALLGHAVFSPAFIQKFVENHLNNEKPAENPLSIDCQQQWHEKGRFGHASYDYSLKVSWSGKAGDAVDIVFQKTKVDTENKPA